MLAVSLAAMAANDVYKWKDANGQWHYGDKPPADQQAEVVPITPPSQDAALPDDAPSADDATQVAQAMQPRTLREVQRGCAAIVNACTGTGKSDTAQCLSEVRPCATDPTMEKQECCPAACSMRYAELRSQGLPEGLSFTRALFGSPSCVLGADEAPK